MRRGLLLRPARLQDLPALLVLIEALAAHHGDQPEATLETLQRDLFQAPTWLTVIVAEVNGTLAGYAALTRLAQLHLGRRGMDLHHLFVAKAQRDRGIGSKLLSAAADFASLAGCRYLTVSTHPENTRAAEYYLKSGFVPVAITAPRFVLRLGDQT